MDFGGVAVFLLGDILQIEPVKGSPVYSAPKDPRLKLNHAVSDLWKKFTVVNLNTNHRQGKDRSYADLLNRIRIGEQTQEDNELLQTRVFKKGDKAIPEDALYISGTNAEVNKVNNLKLSKIKGKKRL